jgi:hypothetical protein
MIGVRNSTIHAPYYCKLLDYLLPLSHVSPSCTRYITDTISLYYDEFLKIRDSRCTDQSCGHALLTN